VRGEAGTKGKHHAAGSVIGTCGGRVGTFGGLPSGEKLSDQLLKEEIKNGKGGIVVLGGSPQFTNGDQNKREGVNGIHG